MDRQIEQKINDINQEFYQKMADSFSTTRRRIQPGVAYLLDTIWEWQYWLDIGCGNGTLAQALLMKFRNGRYIGCDFSAVMIKEAQKKVASLSSSGESRFDFLQLDINHSDWQNQIPHLDWDVISLFAVLHHIPAADKRKRICQQIRKLLPEGKKFLISVWQIQNSPRLMARVQGWETIGLRKEQIEEGDILMDWRSEISASQKPALRYVHIFQEEELDDLAIQSGFRIDSTFYSDGKEGNLALYQIWK